MSLSERQAATDAAPEQEHDDQMVRAVMAWVHQLGRTLKTCRLYDANNPTVVRFRAECATALDKLLSDHGAVTLRFTSDDVLLGETSLYPAKSRDDNLALPFNRDGARAMTFSPGVSPRELDAIIAAVLAVTGPNSVEDDLVTLLWEAQLDHVEIDYVPGDRDFGSGDGDAGDPVSDGLPWPTGSEVGGEGEGEEVEATSAVTVDDEEEEPQAVGGRSDDWATGELTVEIEAGYEELESMAGTETARFRREFDNEHAVPPVTTALAIMRAALTTGVQADDRAEIGRFVPRLLRLSITRGSWLEAREALQILRSCGEPDWSAETFAQELLQPISISTTVEFLDKQQTHGILEFIGFAKTLGDSAVDWLNHLLAESQQRRTRRLLAEAVAELCRDNPERLAPWLADRRWYVVRNIVHILGWIGGPAILPLLQATMRHPEPRVRQEIVGALAKIDTKQARPILLRMLEGADTRTFSAVLHQLSTERNAATARFILGFLQATEFEQRPTEERRAIYSALAGAGGDEIVPDLEAELLRGNWFSRNQDFHRVAVARCLARIGTPTARVVLERGLLSKRAPVRKACEEALSGATYRD
jgi:hypothetical protein